ncbi:MAG: hypothetical protein FXF49_04715 [Flexistipes sinusarabici]|uniref:Uncharacterized protein n=1 Tax=Flexistipes sinusarabici TaxID=2352 RepID=A0A5D0MMU0_FLESI|nr:hypothetical protein [Flexistipes sinusarabici]TYB33712.1 MAG: hypothetical protein FXF49_04715 [Flexistipes sinusarabici]
MKLYSSPPMKLITAEQIPNIDRTAFNWLFRNKQEDKGAYHTTYPPALWEKNGIYYQLNYFSRCADEYFLLENCDFPDALTFSTDFYGSGNLNIIELSNLLFLAENFGYDISAFVLFEKYGVTGDRKIRTLRALKDLPEAIKRYLALKSFSFKTLNLLIRLPDNVISIVESYILKENPSVSDFKKMITKLFDMKEDIPQDFTTYDKNELESVFLSKNVFQENFLDELKHFTYQMKPVEIKNFDNFETDTFDLTFKINSPEDFEKILNQMFEKKEIIKEIYRVMEKYDLH